MWSACDGDRDIDGVVEFARQTCRLPLTRESALPAIEQLSAAGLLDGPVSLPDAGAMSRRRVLTRLGYGAAAAAMVPLVTTILAPTPAEASTCNLSGAACTSGWQCCSGNCLPGGTCA